MFRRKNRVDDAAPEEPSEATGGSDAAAAAEADQPRDVAPVAAARPTGPWDAADAPEAERVDLGGLLLPQDFDIAWRADLDPSGATVVAVSAVLGEAVVQLQPFAAPRSEPLWPEVSDEIEAGLAGEGGRPERRDGPFGPEIHGTAGAGDAQRRAVVFAAVDGPRWLLRLVYSGTGVDGEGRRRLDEVVRGVVVVRGDDPMAPRDLIGLRLPPGAGISR